MFMDQLILNNRLSDVNCSCVKMHDAS